MFVVLEDNSASKTVTIKTADSAGVSSLTGYSFNGWNTSQSGSGTSYTANQVVTFSTSSTADLALYAQKKADTYTISYNASGGSGAPNSQLKTHGVDLTISSTKPTLTGYTFSNWYYTISCSKKTINAGGTFTYNTSTTLYAEYDPISYKIVYNSNGGSGSMSPTTATYDESFTLRTNSFTRTGYDFLGWASSSSATKATYTDGATISTNLTTVADAEVNLYAVWDAKSYTLTLNANGGSVSKSSYTMTYNSTNNNTVNVATKTGYNFLGWYTGGGIQVYDENGKYVSSASSYWSSGKWVRAYDTTLYAQWEPKTYTITFKSNYPSGATSTTLYAQEVEYNSTFTLD